jgi:hypothetical protein
MQAKKFGEKYLLRIDRGEEIVETLKKFCQEQQIKLGIITGLGATNDAEIGLYDIKTKNYYEKKMRGNFEIASLYGNITTMQGETYLHLHANLGDENQHSFSGHLTKAVVSATFEGVIALIDGEVDREKDPKTGLNLLKF